MRKLKNKKRYRATRQHKCPFVMTFCMDVRQQAFSRTTWQL